MSSFEFGNVRNTLLAIVVGSTLVAGCGQGDAKTKAAKRVYFDALGGESSIIQVYPGPTDKENDKVYSGTYNDGDAIIPECITGGREVESDTKSGEPNVTSNMWIGFIGVNGEINFATLVYIRDPNDNIATLPPC